LGRVGETRALGHQLDRFRRKGDIADRSRGRRGWEGLGGRTARSQGDGRFSSIKSRLALALKMLQALPRFNFARGAKEARPDAGQM
jgi:hypothetical protein